MTDPRLLLRTVRHLRLKQIVYQIVYRLHKPRLKAHTAPAVVHGLFAQAPIARLRCAEGDTFTFLNLPRRFPGWDFTGLGMLWAYNLNYFDYINQEAPTPPSDGSGQADDRHLADATKVAKGDNGRPTASEPEPTIDDSREAQQAACHWIDSFIDGLETRRVGLDPYPIALRGINWIKFFDRHPECATRTRLDALYAQYRLLACHLEYHLLGNHLLEDAFSLFVASLYFADRRLYATAAPLLLAELREQTLPDGAHFEQSPMYHCILLDRLLDCCNCLAGVRAQLAKGSAAQGASQALEAFAGDAGLTDTDSRSPISLANVQRSLRDYAARWTAWAEAIVWHGGDIPLVGDAAYGIAPRLHQLTAYAKRLGLNWQPATLGVSGYRTMASPRSAGPLPRLEALLDAGSITATYQPGHAHADALHYMVRSAGRPYIIDTGISTYEKNARRLYERSSAAHNCVCVLDAEGHPADTDEVWSGFRVGRRCSVSIGLDETDHSGVHRIEAHHNAYDRMCSRTWEMHPDGLCVIDRIDAEAVSLLHLAPGLDVAVERTDATRHVVHTPLGDITIDGARSVTVTADTAASTYNRLQPICVVRSYFHGTLKTWIQ